MLAMTAVLSLDIVLEASAVTSFWQLVVCRIVVYSGIGIASEIVPMYQSESTLVRLHWDSYQATGG
jgi:SP family sugar:H+ symporter-like MFS transporter